MLSSPVYTVQVGKYEYNNKFNRYDSLKQYPIIEPAANNPFEKRLYPKDAPAAKEEPSPAAKEEPSPAASEEPSPAANNPFEKRLYPKEAPAAKEEPSPAAKEEPSPAANNPFEKRLYPKEAPAAKEEPSPAAKEEPSPAASEDAPAASDSFEKIMALVVSISPINKVSKNKVSKDIKKYKQSKNILSRKASVDSSLLSFRFDASSNIINYESPYGYNMLYNPKYSTAKIPIFYSDDIETEREKYSTKFIINDKKSKYMGFILDITTKAILSAPLAPLLNKLNKSAIKLVDSHLKNNLYEIIKIEDGTIITLYSWMHPQNGIMWSMASNRGYDVSSFKWMGKMTYAEIFYDLVERLYPEFKALTGMGILYISLNGEVKTILTFSNLDPTKCYSLGFRHHNFHPLKIDPEKIWQVQYSDLSTKNEIIQVYSGGFFPPEILPVQEICQYSKFVSTDSTQAISYSIIEKKGESSFINACIECGKYIEKSSLFADDDDCMAASSYIPQYGFILRSLDISQTGDLSNIIIEYPLFINIKKLIYEHFNKDALINETNRMKYNAMRAFLNDGRGDIFTSYKKKFIALYPEWSAKFYVFEQFIAQLTIQIRLNIIYQQKKEKHSHVESLTMGDLKINKEKFEKIAIDFANMIKQHFKINKYTNIHNLEKIIRDYIQNWQYASIYLHILKT